MENILTCPYCETPAKLTDSAVIYRRSYGPVWVCGRYPGCDSYVGCHPGTTKPLGRMADKELRDAKMAAHRAFDPRWRDKVEPGRTKNQTRNHAYKWLARAMGIPFEKCHIGDFDVAQCREVVRVCA